MSEAIANINWTAFNLACLIGLAIMGAAAYTWLKWDVVKLKRICKRQSGINRALWDQIQRDLLIRAGDEWLYRAYAPKNDGYRRLVEPWYYDGVNKPNPCLYEHPSPAQQFLEYRVGADSEKAGNHENNI